MKHFVVCLTLALFCGVVLSDSFTNTTNPWLCAQARQNITKAVEGIETQRSRIYPDVNEVDHLQNTILFNRRMANYYCAPEELCYDAKSRIAKAREDLATQNRKTYPDTQIVSQLNQDISYFKDQIDRTCQGAEVCANAKTEVKKAKEEIATEKRRMYSDAGKISSLEGDVAEYMRVIAWRCPANESCAFAHAELTSSREALATEMRRTYSDANEITKLNRDIAFFKDQIDNTCPGAEVCTNAKTEVQKAKEMMATEKRRMYPDAGKISSLEEDVLRYKRVIAWRCPENESCAFGHAELTLSREALATEKRRSYPDAKEVANLEADITNSSELIFATCTSSEVCSFVHAEITKTQNGINTEKRRSYTDVDAIAKLERHLTRLNEVQFYRCGGGGYGFMRLAENVVRGGRFLAKMLRH